MQLHVSNPCADHRGTLIAPMVLMLLLAASQGARAQNISTFAGNGDTTKAPGDGGQARAAPLNRPLDVTFASSGDLLIADYGDEGSSVGHHRIRRVDADGVITTVAGDGNPGNSGDFGTATEARLNGPISVAVDTTGNVGTTGNVYIADYYNNRVRVVFPNGVIEPFAGTGNSDFGGDGFAATQAWLQRPAGLAIDSLGNVFIADQGNHRIRRVDAITRVITTVAGNGVLDVNGNSVFTSDGTATAVPVSSPYGLTFDLAGDLVICETSGCPASLSS